MLKHWKRQIIFFVTLSLSIIFIAHEFSAREQLRSKARKEEHIQNMLFYTNTIEHVPNKELSFRFYKGNGTLVASADIRMNNMGFYSKKNYSLNKEKDEFRIVIVGGEQTASSVANISWPDLLEDELNKTLNKKTGLTYKVYNIACPDMGPKLYENFLKEKGIKFQPDLIVVNFVETDFYRAFVGAPIKYKKINIKPEMVEYKLSESKEDGVKFEVGKIHDKLVKSISDPEVVPNRPFGIFANKTFIDDVEKIKKLQDMLINDLVEGAMPTFGKLSFLRIVDLIIPTWDPKASRYHNFLNQFSVHQIRNYDPPPTTPLDYDAAVKYVHGHFRNIFDAYPKVIFTHSRNHPEILGDVKFALTEKLLQLDSELPIIDIKQYLPVSKNKDEIDTWYLQCMQEKWSDKGHKIYAESMTRLLVDHFQKEEGLSKEMDSIN